MLAVRAIVLRFTVAWPAAKGANESRPPPPIAKLWLVPEKVAAVVLPVTNCNVPPLSVVKLEAVLL